jgi:hypothetical protein
LQQSYEIVTRTVNPNLIDPFHDTVNVETMCTRAPNDWTVVTWKFAIRTTSVKGHTTNTASVVVGDPLPENKIVKETLVK